MSFIGIKIPYEVSKKLDKIKVPGQKEDIDEYHITLIHFSEEHSIKDIFKITSILTNFLNEFKTFEVKTHQLTCFPKFQENPVPIITKIQGKKLFELQSKLKNELEKMEVDFSKTFKEYKPHITLSYAEKEIESKEIQQLSFEVNEITYFGGSYGELPKVKIDFSLINKKKSKKLSEKTKLFKKLSKLK